MSDQETDQFPIFPICRVSADEFVKFWFPQYKDPLEPLYVENINEPASPKRTLDLYRWKNGGPLSTLKTISVKKNYIKRIDEVLKIPHSTTAEEFLIEFSTGGAIWRIFWLHCWWQQFPIYDQHVHRAMMFIETGRFEEMMSKDADKIQSYLNDYIPFHRRFAHLDQREVDRALWTFGKFIKSYQIPAR